MFWQLAIGNWNVAPTRAMEVGRVELGFY